MLNQFAAMLSLLLFMSSSITLESQITYGVSYDIQDAIASYNEENPTLIESHKALGISGEITFHSEIVENIFFLKAEIENHGEIKGFSFQYDSETIDFEVKPIITNGAIGYIKDNLIIRDKDSGKNYLFILAGSQSRFKNITPIEGIGIGAYHHPVN